MATQRPRSKRSAAKKVPAKAKRGTAPARKAAKSAKRSGAPRGAKTSKGKARTASTRSHRGASKAPKRSPAASPERAGRAQAAKQTQAESGGEGGAAETPGAHRRARVVVENVNVPGYRTSVDAGMYEAMRTTLFGVLPRGPPGLTQTEMMDATRAKAPRELFPGGAKTEWWTKCVQLDQEAKGAMKRSATKPIRWWRV